MCIHKQVCMPGQRHTCIAVHIPPGRMSAGRYCGMTRSFTLESLFQSGVCNHFCHRCVRYSACGSAICAVIQQKGCMSTAFISRSSITMLWRMRTCIIFTRCAGAESGCEDLRRVGFAYSAGASLPAGRMLKSSPKAAPPRISTAPIVCRVPRLSPSKSAEKNKAERGSR